MVVVWRSMLATVAVVITGTVAVVVDGYPVSSSPPTPRVCRSHSALLMQQFIMLGHVQAFLTGLKVFGFELDVKVAFKRYAIASLGPYLILPFAYYVFTMSSLFTSWFVAPVAVFEYAGAIATFKVASCVHRRLKASSNALSNEGDGRCMVEVKRIATESLAVALDSKSYVLNKILMF